MNLAPRRVLGLLRSRTPSRVYREDRDVFPRSKLMRAIVNPDNRPLWIAGAAALAVLFPKLVRLEAAAALLSKYRQISRHMTQLRH
jgi:hypothetical protein